MSEIIPTSNDPRPSLMVQAGQAANRAAGAVLFDDFTARKSANTLRRYTADLACFAAFLAGVGIQVEARNLMTGPGAWQGLTWGMVEAFKRWMLTQGYAVSTVNFRIYTVRQFARLAQAAGAIPPGEAALINDVKGYRHREGRELDSKREAAGNPTRRSTKKAESATIPPDLADQLLDQPDTPQGRRDAVLLALLLDHGLRAGELAGLQVQSIDLEAGIMTFYREKVDKVQTHRLEATAAARLRAYLAKDQTAQTGPLLLASRKGGRLTHAGMTARNISQRVKGLFDRAGLTGVSAHDLRHYWATQAARHKTPLDRLQEAGGWSSVAMPSRYIAAAKIANEGVNLGRDNESGFSSNRTAKFSRG